MDKLKKNALCLVASLSDFVERRRLVVTIIMSRGFNILWIYSESVNGNQDTVCLLLCLHTLAEILNELCNHLLLSKTFYETFLKRICFLIAKKPMCLYGMGE